MATLTADQVARAQAWARVFEDGPALVVVLSDMRAFARSLGEPLERAGATEMLLFVLERRAHFGRQKGKHG